MQPASNRANPTSAAQRRISEASLDAGMHRLDRGLRQRAMDLPVPPRLWSTRGRPVGRRPVVRQAFDDVEAHRNEEDGDQAPASIPPNTARPRRILACAPAPEERISGTTPRINANAVMRIGRNRSRTATNAASMMLLPCSYSSLANSTIRLAFLAERPISITRPIWRNTSFSLACGATSLKSHRVPNAPNTAIGVTSSTLKGRAQLSYCAARMRNTHRMENPKMTLAGTPSAATFSWKDIPM